MVQINFSLKEVNCKVVYYGPGLSGKTTNLEIVHHKAPSASVGDLTSIATEGDRTLFFDFLPLDLGQVAGMKTKFQIYTVPGQVYYNSTRKLVLQGADGIVYVADSKRGKMDENIESLNNLLDNLKEYGMNIDTTPVVMQYNKRDLPEIYSIEEMNEALNKWGFPYFEAVARDGVGVFPTLKHLAGMVLESLNRQHGGGGSVAVRKPSQPAAASGAPAAAAPAAAAAAAPTAVATAPRPQPQPARVAAAATAPPPQTPPPSGGGAGTVAPAAAPPPSVAPASVAPKAPAAPSPAAASSVARVAKAEPAGAAEPEKKGKGLLVVGIVVVLLGAAGAAAHFTGLLENLLP